MSIAIVIICIAILVLLISYWKLNPFLAFLIICIVAGIALGLNLQHISTAIQKGIGDMLGSVIVIIVCGSMLGKIVAESGAAQVIATAIIKLFGTGNVQWALMITGFIIGIPLFYTVGFVLVIPIIFSVVYQYKLPAVYIGLPMMAALSVTHGFLPPHPSPSALIGMFKAEMADTLLYGIIIAIPTLVIAGPIFSKTLKSIPSTPNFVIKESTSKDPKPGLVNSLVSALLPVIILASATFTLPYLEKGKIYDIVSFFADPQVVLIFSVFIATYSLGVHQGKSLSTIMNGYADSVKDIAMLLLIISGAGALKEILVQTHVSDEIASFLNDLSVNPLILGWLIASVTRVCVGSATVAGLTAAGIILPLVQSGQADPNLMVLSIGAGSLMFSHVNDAGFWLFKEYFNLSIKDTIRSWSLMESIVAVCGLIGVLVIDGVR